MSVISGVNAKVFKMKEKFTNFKWILYTVHKTGAMIMLKQKKIEMNKYYGYIYVHAY